ncbi:MAG: class I SAM-dependent methyltransferase [Candidatus Ratteibacteria bacterium]|jgi:SAM-dependent methyltransferase
MKLTNTGCAICGSLQNYTVIYEQNFRESDFNADVFSARRMPDSVHYRIVKCNKDGLMRSSPVLEDSAVYALYKNSSFTYGNETENLTISYLAALMPLLRGLPKDAKILEVGCGNGFLLKTLYNLGYKNVFGIEPSVDAVEKSDKDIRNKITTGILRTDTFKSGTFNLIYFFQLLDHVPDPDNFLKICYALLSPGGFMLAFNHDVESLSARLLKERSPVIDIEHSYFFCKQTIKKISEKNNFLITRIYSPANVISLKHIIWLLPIPGWIKLKLLSLKAGIFCSILKQKIRIKIGNLCLIATK